MKKNPAHSSETEELLLNLTFHNFPASLLAEFAEKIVTPYYNDNLNAAIQDLMQKALQEQDFVLSHITHVKAVPAS
jgi:hypothetical protein